MFLLQTTQEQKITDNAAATVKLERFHGVILK